MFYIQFVLVWDVWPLSWQEIPQGRLINLALEMLLSFLRRTGIDGIALHWPLSFQSSIFHLFSSLFAPATLGINIHSKMCCMKGTAVNRKMGLNYRIVISIISVVFLIWNNAGAFLLHFWLLLLEFKEPYGLGQAIQRMSRVLLLLTCQSTPSPKIVCEHCRVEQDYALTTSLAV